MKIFRTSFYFLLFTFTLSRAQTLEGTTGLFLIPTAEMQNDKQVTIGTNYVHKSLISFGGYKLDAFTPFISINFLPFVEISGKITRVKRLINDKQGIGDRTISVRIRLLNENNSIPSITIGLQDLAGIYGGPEAVRNNALYIVLSKHILLKNNNNLDFGLHAGYGLDRIKAQHHNFVGLFGGVSLKLFHTLEIMGEYDGKYSNTGIRVHLFDRFSILGGLLQLKHFSGGAAFSFVL